jgi:hypothetical protein
MEKVVTGHYNGVITLDLAEGDDVHRAQLRIAMDEPYRTVLGHLRHEIGHYCFYRLVGTNRRLACSAAANAANAAVSALLERPRVSLHDVQSSLAAATVRVRLPDNRVISQPTIAASGRVAATIASFPHSTVVGLPTTSTLRSPVIT